MPDVAQTGFDDSAGRPRFPVHIIVFLAPALAIYTVFSVYPLVDTIRLSLYAGDEAGQHHFVGLANFRTLLRDPAWSGQFWNALSNNLIFFAIHMVVQNGIGLGLAMLLSLPRLTGGQHLPHPALPPHDAVRRHHRVHLAAHPQPAVGRCRGTSRLRRPRRTSSGPGWARNRRRSSRSP